MAGSRQHQVGTIFSRVTGLLRRGAIKHEDKPVWYDVMAAFPPKIEPTFHRSPQSTHVADIIYKEDIIRVKFYDIYGNTRPIDLRDTSTVITSERFIKEVLKIEKDPEKAIDETFNEVVEKLRDEGIILKSIDDMKKAKEEMRLAAQKERQDLELERRRKTEELSRQPLTDSVDSSTSLEETDIQAIYENETST